MLLFFAAQTYPDHFIYTYKVENLKQILDRDLDYLVIQEYTRRLLIPRVAWDSHLVDVTARSFRPSNINPANLTILNYIQLYIIVSCSGLRLPWKLTKKLILDYQDVKVTNVIKDILCLTQNRKRIVSYFGFA